jgi:hypothetical protein
VGLALGGCVGPTTCRPGEGDPRAKVEGERHTGAGALNNFYK